MILLLIVLSKSSKIHSDSVETGSGILDRLITIQLLVVCTFNSIPQKSSFQRASHFFSVKSRQLIWLLSKSVSRYPGIAVVWFQGQDIIILTILQLNTLIDHFCKNHVSNQCITECSANLQSILASKRSFLVNMLVLHEYLAFYQDMKHNLSYQVFVAVSLV